MSTYILIHGAWHGVWAWYHIAPLLRKQGHKVIVPDLPGFGRDRSISPSTGTLRIYTDHLSHIIKEQNEPVILVGHSMGGIVISQTAEECSESIQKLIYLAAFLVPNVTTLHEHAQKDKDAIILQNTHINETQGVSEIPVERVADLFYHDCPESDITLVQMLIGPTPLEPFSAIVKTTDRFARIPRFYVETLHDRANSLYMQRYMQRNLPCERVFSLSTGHSPFFAAPNKLAEILLSLA
ncbi:hypothetical protein KSD_97000 [Ktedonobacter sp. SOSP1-85]|uniref:alpha/beta fold hydrolase n=1 Tax=Ktedonobacter sp. SOSP1-85 TaxID=2778367 RepID=UPI001915E1AC|nr:alpha/beta fold hydrolase [Ktedonobacter sp. SOSP1-85]GHO81929.1 hypothetical protein KSD_97000 [Ktedonobacter sp. SOSP1-85]